MPGFEDENIESEINKAFHNAEGVRASGEDIVAKELADESMRSLNIKNAIDVFEIFGGDGLADAMPLGEAIGFIEVVLSGEHLIGRRKITAEEKGKLEKARDFLLDLDKEEYPEEMELGAVIEKFKKEERGSS